MVQIESKIDLTLHAIRALLPVTNNSCIFLYWVSQISTNQIENLINLRQ